MSSPYLFVGLGNPGFRYQATRHNIGFIFLDFISEQLDLPTFSYEKKFLAFLSSMTLSSKKVIFLKPDTYMNKSGDAVSKLVSYFNITKENIFVIHDDMDFDFGVQKIRFGGGAAGHNGIKSVIQMLGDQEFYRIRLGIGKPEGAISPRDYVLQKFLDVEINFIQNDWCIIWKDLVHSILHGGVVQAMNKFNKRSDI